MGQTDSKIEKIILTITKEPKTGFECVSELRKRDPLILESEVRYKVWSLVDRGKLDLTPDYRFQKKE